MERRSLTEPVEVREESRTIAGYAAVFNSDAVIGGQFRERILPGAFGDAVEGDVAALYNHDSGAVLGRTTAGTLRLREDDHGLAIEVDLPNTTVANDLRENLRLKNIRGMSFGFNVPKGGDSWDFESEMPVRTISKLDVAEVSVVTFPAYDATEVALRSLDDAKKSAEHERDKAEHNAAQAQARIAARRAAAEQKFRGIKPLNRWGE
jgi:HK97 family phage prohead protease